MEALKRAIDLFGGQAGLAAAIGVKQQHIWNWINRGKSVPAEHCPAIERATRALAASKPGVEVVTCEELSPDVDWAVLREQGAKDAIEQAAAHSEG